MNTDDLRKHATDIRSGNAMLFHRVADDCEAAADEIKPPPPRHTPLATDGEYRGNGVYATDRQMAARNGMTLRQWLDKQRAREAPQNAV